MSRRKTRTEEVRREFVDAALRWLGTTMTIKRQMGMTLEDEAIWRIARGGKCSLEEVRYFEERIREWGTQHNMEDVERLPDPRTENVIECFFSGC